MENKNRIAEVLIYKNKKVLKKSYFSDDMYKSINETFEILDREIRKYKEKLRTERRQGIHKIRNN